MADKLKKFKEKQIKIDFPAYHYRVYIIKTNDIIASRKKRDVVLQSTYKDQVDDKYIFGMHSYKEGEFDSYIFLSIKTDVNTIAHEAYHAVYRMFMQIGEDSAGEEVFAYTLGYLVEEIDKFMKCSKF